MKIRVKTKRINWHLIPHILLAAIVFSSFGAGDAFGQKRRNPVKKTAAKTVVKPLPDLKLPDLSGAEWSLHKNLGKVVLINFWATWCAPCRAETPVLVNLDREFKERGLEIVGIALDDDGKGNIARFAGEFKVEYPILLPVPGSTLSRIDPVPTTLLIDPQGRLAKKYVGAIPEKILRADIEKLMSGVKVKNDTPKASKDSKNANSLKTFKLMK